MGKRVKKRDRVHQHLLHTAWEWEELCGRGICRHLVEKLDGITKVYDEIASQVRDIGSQVSPTRSESSVLNSHNFNAASGLAGGFFEGYANEYAERERLEAEARAATGDPTMTAERWRGIQEGWEQSRLCGQIAASIDRMTSDYVKALDREFFDEVGGTPATYTIDIPEAGVRFETTDPESIAASLSRVVEVNYNSYGTERWIATRYDTGRL